MSKIQRYYLYVNQEGQFAKVPDGYTSPPDKIGVLVSDHEAAMNRLTHYMNEQIARKQREIETHTADLAACRSALDNCLETLVYVKQYFDGSGLSALDDVNESIKIAQAARKEAEPKPSILDHEDISGDNLLGG